MAVSHVFFVTALLTAVFIGLQIYGYPVLPIALAFLLLDFIEVMLMGTLKKYEHTHDDFIKKSEHCHDILMTKDEHKDSLDKMALKVIEIENNMHDFRKTVGAAIGSFEDRMKDFENTVEVVVQEKENV